MFQFGRMAVMPNCLHDQNRIALSRKVLGPCGYWQARILCHVAREPRLAKISHNSTQW